MVVTINNLNDLIIKHNDVNLKVLIKLHEKIFDYTPEEAKARIKKYIQNKNGIIITAHEPNNNNIVGYSIATPLTETADLPYHKLMIDTTPTNPTKMLYQHYGGTVPEYRRKGLWISLFKQSLECAKEKGFTHTCGFYKPGTSEQGVKKLLGPTNLEYIVDDDAPGTYQHYLIYSL